MQTHKQIQQTNKEKQITKKLKTIQKQKPEIPATSKEHSGGGADGRVHTNREMTGVGTNKK